MCTKLTQNGKIIIAGEMAIINTKDNKPEILSFGIPDMPEPRLNARMESLTSIWLRNKYQIGTIEIDSFFEKDKQFKFKYPKKIGVIYKFDHFLIITEPANKQVSKTHHRQPCFENLKTLLKRA